MKYIVLLLFLPACAQYHSMDQIVKRAKQECSSVPDEDAQKQYCIFAWVQDYCEKNWKLDDCHKFQMAHFCEEGDANEGTN